MPSHGPWRVIFFEEADGSKPVFDYIFAGGLSDKDIAVISNILVSLQNQGPEIQGTDMDKPIEGPIRELRKDRHRILYAQHGHSFVLLTAFLKKTQKTPRDLIDLALKRYEQFKQNNPKLP